MKSILLNTLWMLVIAFGFISCRDEDKDPWQDFTTPTGAMILVDEVVTPVFDVTDLTNATYEAVLRDPAENVQSMAISVSLNGGDAFPLRTVTDFSTNLVVSATDVATALGLTIDQLHAGDQIVMSSMLTRNDGQIFTKEDLGDDLFGNPGQRQGYEITTFVSCPFSAAEAAGTYDIVTDPFAITINGGEMNRSAVIGADDTQIIMEDLFGHPNPDDGGFYNIIVDVDPSSGAAVVPKQEAWHCDNFSGCQFGQASVESAASGNFFFSCTGFLTVNLRHTVALGSFGIFKLEMQKQ